MKIITVTDQKGGSAKTTTAEALAAGLSLLHGARTLLVDLDPQANLTYSTCAETDGVTIFDILTRPKKVKLEDAIQHTGTGDIIPGSQDLSGADAFINKTGKEYVLKNALLPLHDLYDYCIIDTAPSLSILTINALTASDSIIIPALADAFNLQGIAQLAETIQLVREYCNPNLRIAGILLTRYNSRTVLSREVTELVEQLAAELNTKLFKTKIREAVAVREAQISHKNLYAYAPKAMVTTDYTAFIDEFLKGEKNNEQ